MNCKSDVLSKNEIIRRTNLTKLTLNNFLIHKPYELKESNFEEIKFEIDKQKEIKTHYTKKQLLEYFNIDKKKLNDRLQKYNIQGDLCLLDNNVYFSEEDFKSIESIFESEKKEKDLKIKEKSDELHGYDNILKYRVEEKEKELDLKLTSHKEVCDIFNKNRCLIIDYFSELNIKPVYIMRKAFYTDKDIEKLKYFISHRKEFTKKKNIEKYGVEYPSQSKDIKEKTANSRMNNLLKTKGNLYSVIELCEIFHKDRTTIPLVIKTLNLPYSIINNNMCIDKISFEKLKLYFSITEMNGTSYCEKELLDFVKSIYKDEVVENSKNIISPLELDIYIPNKNLAIEFNGLYWHNELNKDKNYHLNKTNLCNEFNIDLIHVFEDDWKCKKDIIKSIISSRLGIYEKKIFARKCSFEEITRIQAKKFLNENHIQGFAKSDKFYALIHENEIVQIIAITMKGFHDGNVELTRMATKLNVQVVGGFSKLMKNFCKLMNVKRVVSYVDKSLFNGKGYFGVGFEVVKENPPTYSFIVKEKRLHKSNFRKNKLKKMYENGILRYFDENDTEKNICFKNGIFRIYNCGTVKVIYEC